MPCYGTILDRQGYGWGHERELLMLCHMSLGSALATTPTFICGCGKTEGVIVFSLRWANVELFGAAEWGIMGWSLARAPEGG